MPCMVDKIRGKVEIDLALLFLCRNFRYSLLRDVSSIVVLNWPLERAYEGLVSVVTVRQRHESALDSSRQLGTANTIG